MKNDIDFVPKKKKKMLIVRTPSDNKIFERFMQSPGFKSKKLHKDDSNNVLVVDERDREIKPLAIICAQSGPSKKLSN